MQNGKKLFDGTYCGNYHETNISKLTEHTANATAAIKKHNRKLFPYEITSKSELKENSYPADNYKGVRQFVKMTYKIVWNIPPPPQNDAMERLRKFQRNEKKYYQRQQKTNSAHIKSSRSKVSEQPQSVVLEIMEPIIHSVDSPKDVKNYSEKWNLNTERAYDLKNLLEERERYFNGEMDELYYRAGPDRHIMPTPTNLKYLTGGSTLSSRQDTSIHAIKNSDESLGFFSEISFDFSFFPDKRE